MSAKLTSEEIEKARLEIERERLNLEKVRAEAEKRFVNKNLGTIVTAIVSLAAIIVSIGQVWVSYIQKEKELVLSSAQKFKELEMAGIKQNREYGLSIGDFVMKNSDAIFGKNEEKRTLVKNVLLTTFDESVTKPLVDNFVEVSEGEARASWIDAQRHLAKATSGGKQTNATLPSSTPSPRASASPAQLLHRDPGDSMERSALAVASALSSLTEIVSIESVSPLRVQPSNLFDLTFARVGVDSDALIHGFKTFLKANLPEIKDEIDRMNISPALTINAVVNYVHAALQKN